VVRSDARLHLLGACEDVLRLGRCSQPARDCVEDVLQLARHLSEQPESLDLLGAASLCPLLADVWASASSSVPVEERGDLRVVLEHLGAMLAPALGLDVDEQRALAHDLRLGGYERLAEARRAAALTLVRDSQSQLAQAPGAQRRVLRRALGGLARVLADPERFASQQGTACELAVQATALLQALCDPRTRAAAGQLAPGVREARRLAARCGRKGPRPDVLFVVVDTRLYSIAASTPRANDHVRGMFTPFGVVVGPALLSASAAEQRDVLVHEFVHTRQRVLDGDSGLDKLRREGFTELATVALIGADPMLDAYPVERAFAAALAARRGVARRDARGLVALGEVATAEALLGGECSGREGLEPALLDLYERCLERLSLDFDVDEAWLVRFWTAALVMLDRYDVWWGEPVMERVDVDAGEDPGHFRFALCMRGASRACGRDALLYDALQVDLQPALARLDAWYAETESGGA
jgi:hypothetical protein